MNRSFAAAVLMIFSVATSAAGQEAPLISTARLQKLLKFADAIGTKEELAAPIPIYLGLSTNPFQALPVVSVVTTDHQVFFCRSRVNPKDFVIWAHIGNTSYMFSTHADFKLIGAIYLEENEVPKVEDVNSSKVRSVYKDALKALAKDVDNSHSP
jgi:hypothetical protein